MAISEIARVMGVARNTVNAALATGGSPQYRRAPREALADRYWYASSAYKTSTAAATTCDPSVALKGAGLRKPSASQRIVIQGESPGGNVL
jgi:uncharacterized NAD(P)/FAD-binding protein YdhS